MVRSSTVCYTKSEFDPFVRRNSRTSPSTAGCRRLCRLVGLSLLKINVSFPEKILSLPVQRVPFHVMTQVNANIDLFLIFKNMCESRTNNKDRIMLVSLKHPSNSSHESSKESHVDDSSWIIVIKSRERKCLT